jgi:hypothetical protein
MTRDDIESVMAAFTSDGTDSAFGKTYRVAGIPAPAGRRLATRSMTFLRRNGASDGARDRARDRGRPRDPGRRLPGKRAAS